METAARKSVSSAKTGICSAGLRGSWKAIFCLSPRRRTAGFRRGCACCPAARAAFPDALPIPYPIGAVAQKLSEKKRDTPPLSLDKTSHAVRLFGKTVRLSELEFSLLSYLVSYRGEEAAREAILRDVFGGGTTPGMLNVYIHYLREKLGFAGRVILSSRGGGYRLAPELTGKNDLRKEEENGGC